MAVGSGGRLIVAGVTDGSWDGTHHGQGDYLVVALGTSAQPPSPAPTSPATPAPATNTTPTTPTAPRVTTQPLSPVFTRDASPAPTQLSAMVPTLQTPPPVVTLVPTLYSDHDPERAASNSFAIVAGVASVLAAVVLLAVGLWRRRRRTTNNKRGKQSPLRVDVVDGGNSQRPVASNYQPPLPPYEDALTLAAVATAADAHGGGGYEVLPAAHTGTGQSRDRRTVLIENGRDGGDGGGIALVKHDTRPTTRTGKASGGDEVKHADGDARDDSAGQGLAVTTSTITSSADRRESFSLASSGDSVPGAVSVADQRKFASNGIGGSSPTGRRESSGGPGLGHAVAELAQQLALNSQIPGISEAAGAVSIVVKLLTDNRDNKNGTEASLKRCRSIVVLLQRAAKVLGKVSCRCPT